MTQRVTVSGSYCRAWCKAITGYVTDCSGEVSGGRRCFPGSWFPPSLCLGLEGGLWGAETTQLAFEKQAEKKQIL